MTEWDQRELCPDGACTGVIGANGLCKVCGRAAQNWGDDRRRGLIPEAEAAAATGSDADSATATATATAAAADAASEADSDAAYEWSRRRLCPDGACTGVIGADRRCTVCGKEDAA